MHMHMLLTNQVEQPSGHVTLVSMPITPLPSARENNVGVVIYRRQRSSLNISHFLNVAILIYPSLLYGLRL